MRNSPYWNQANENLLRVGATPREGSEFLDTISPGVKEDQLEEQLPVSPPWKILPQWWSDFFCFVVCKTALNTNIYMPSVTCVCVRRRPRTPLASWCDSLTPAFLIRQCRQGLDVTTVLLFCLLQSIDTLFLLAFPVLHLFLFFFFTPAWQYCRQKDKNIRGRHELTSSVETWLFFLLL